MGALIYKKLPEEKFGAIFGGISSCFLGNILFKFLFSIIVILLPVELVQNDKTMILKLTQQSNIDKKNLK